MIRKRILALGAMLALLVLLCVDAAPSAGAFTDVPSGAWYAESVKYVSGEGIMNGVTADRFNPDGAVTRGMIVTILYRVEGSPAQSASPKFGDVAKGSYCEKAVVWATAAGIANGYSDRAFGPNDYITREQFATFLYRYSAHKKLLDTEKTDKNLLASFKDADKVAAYAREAMCWAIEQGVVNGTSAVTLTPKGTATRAQAAAIIARYDAKKKAAAEQQEKEQPIETAKSNPAPVQSDPTPVYSDPTPVQQDPVPVKPEKPVATSPTLSVSSDYGKAGENVRISVEVQKNPGILGMTLSVKYDDSALELIGAENGSALGVLNFTKPGKLQPNCSFLWDGEEISASDVEDGSVLELTFKIKPGTSAGKYPVTIYYQAGDIIDNDLAPLTFKIENGSITLR